MSEVDLAKHELRKIRVCLAIVIVGLVLSGVTAFPLETEVGWLQSMLDSYLLRTIAEESHLLPWVRRVHEGLAETNHSYPFLAYGTDWLAFAHLMLAILFVGTWRDPLRNRWVIQFGLIACAAVVLLAMVAGPLRGIPWEWRLIDCSFGIGCAVPLGMAWKGISKVVPPTP
ncbi:conserved hypothetical protein [Candidatus Koribacter versatilis Ellin345]|uniref:Transmembrane protein n=1 Tax=Koribacter versatilis (strain Ellin345) TaxID=204669 RepID=Q1ILW5_KORVE|nr:hypothetical protein [Candidatus Koribacter versatilis]ABF42135.1 conserved hypothetical protein [Candidatus Koribacter versatilis Ellin345]